MQSPFSCMGTVDWFQWLTNVIMCTNNTTTFSKECVIIFQNKTVWLCGNILPYDWRGLSQNNHHNNIRFFFFQLILFELQFNGHSVECIMKNHIHLSIQEWVLFYVLTVPYTKSSYVFTKYCCLDSRDFIWTGSLALFMCHIL